MKEQRRVQIVNSSEPFTTRVVDSETGEPIPMVQAVSFSMDANKDGLTRAVIRTIMPRVDVVADATIEAVCPYCGKPEDA